MAGLGHISATQLAMFGRCPAQYEFRYIRGMILPPAVAQVRGRAAHKGREVGLRYRQETGEVAPEDLVCDAARDEAKTLFRGGPVLLGPEEEGLNIRLVEGQTIDKAVALAAVDRLVFHPRIHPLSVETMIRRSLRPLGADVMLVGIIDALDHDMVVHDLKTATRAPQRAGAEHSLQATVYHVLCCLSGLNVRRISFEYLVEKKKGFDTHVERVSRDSRDVKALVYRIRALMHARETGSFPPTLPENWWCSERFCGYYKECPYVR